MEGFDGHGVQSFLHDKTLQALVAAVPRFANPACVALRATLLLLQTLGGVTSALPTKELFEGLFFVHERTHAQRTVIG
jgi:hypothetical protein